MGYCSVMVHKHFPTSIDEFTVASFVLLVMQLQFLWQNAWIKKEADIAMIVWLFDFHLPMQSVLITTNAVTLISFWDKVCSIQHYKL
jgi:hypothetical protein